jgi:hypothetical protein
MLFRILDHGKRNKSSRDKFHRIGIDGFIADFLINCVKGRSISRVRKGWVLP